MVPHHAGEKPLHTTAYRRRRFFNWFPLGRIVLGISLSLGSSGCSTYHVPDGLADHEILCISDLQSKEKSWWAPTPALLSIEYRASFDRQAVMIKGADGMVPAEPRLTKCSVFDAGNWKCDTEGGAPMRFHNERMETAFCMKFLGVPYCRAQLQGLEFLQLSWAQFVGNRHAFDGFCEEHKDSFDKLAQL